MRRVLCIASLINLGVLVSLQAQQLKPMFVRWEPETSLAHAKSWGAHQGDTLPVLNGDYRYEGLVIGGLALGALGAWVGFRISEACPTVPGAQCNTDRLGNAVALGLVSTAVGGGVGYLIGRLSPKLQRPVTQTVSPSALPESTRQRVGYQHWKGAAIGSGSGALLGVLLIFGVRGSCSDCSLTSADFLKMSALGAGFGGALGFLVGLTSPKYE